MPLDIRPDHLKTVQEILERIIPDREVWVFGSRVNGTAKGTSDLDLVVIAENPLDFKTLGALRDAFSESDIPYKVDVVDWATISETFREIIRKDKVVIQKGLTNEVDKCTDINGEEWIECKLSEVCSSIDYGLTASAIDTPVGPRFLRITDIVGGTIDWKSVPYVKLTESMFRKFQLNSKDIVVARTGASTGSSMYINNPPPAVFASYLVRLKIKTEIDSRFIAYYLKSSNFWSFIHGVLGEKSAQPNASARTLTQAPLKAPKNKNSQRAIAHILGTLDDKIELNRRMNETLEAMAQALFKSWFVDFDPVRAKMEGRPTGLPKEIEDLFPDSFENSELGEIPKGWSVGPLTNVFEIVGGGTPKTTIENYWNGNIPWFSVEDSPKESDIWVIDTKRKITQKGLLNSSTKILSIGSVIITARGTVGKIALVGIPMAMNQSCYGIHGKFPANFWTYFSIKELIAGLKQNVHGSVFDTITRNTLERIFLVIPPNKILEVFETQVKSILNNIRLNLNESHNLSNIREILLPKLLSGDIRVSKSFGHNL